MSGWNLPDSEDYDPEYPSYTDEEWDELAADMGHDFYSTPICANAICRRCGLIPFDDDAVSIPCSGERP